MSDTERPTFEQVYEAELTHLVNLATFILGSRAAAEDAVHDSFIKLHQAWFTVDNPGAFVQRATVNRCKDLLRHDRGKRKHLDLIAGGEPPVPAVDDLDRSTDLIDALRQLEPKRRMIVVLRFYGQHSLAEIADLLAIPDGTVESNLYRGLKQLRKLLADESLV